MPSGEQARLKSIVETAVDGIVTIDEQGVIESFNPAAERLFGYAADEAIGKNVSLLMPLPFAERHDEYLARYIATGENKIISIGREVTGLRKDGSTFPMRISVGEFRLGDERRFTGIVHDLTELKQKERLSAIGQTVTALTHESRNALQLSQANLEMLAIELKDVENALCGVPNDGEATSLTQTVQTVRHRGRSLQAAFEYIGHIQTAQNRLQRLFRDLREFASPVTLDRECCNLQPLVGQVLNELSGLHANKQIRLCHETNGLDLRCPVDPFRMHQVFRNILENSIAVCPDPVRIDVAWSQSNLNGTSALRVALRDNGPGLTTEQKQKSFDPFFTTKKGGTGLGLAITRRIVEAHGGQIAAEDNHHSGAEFVITLPQPFISD